MRKINVAQKKLLFILAFSLIATLFFAYIVSLIIAKNNSSVLLKKEINKPASNESAGDNYDNVIRIGANLALSGIKAENDSGSVVGAELAEERINSMGGILGKKLKIVIYDNKSTPPGAKNAAEDAVKDGVVGMIGAIRSSQTLALAPVLQTAGVPLITPMSTVDEISKIGDYIFRICYTDSLQGRVLAKYALEELKVKNVVIFEMIDEEYSTVLSKSFTAYYTANGGKILAVGSYQTKNMDFSHLINIIKDKNPPLVFLPGYSKDGGFIMRQAKNSGVKVQFLGGDGWGLQLFDFGGDSVEGAIGADHWHIEMKYPLTAELINIHEKKYGTSVIKSTGTPLAFDAILLMVDAINRAKSTDGKQIRDAIAATKNFPGSSGIYSFDENGDALNKGVAIVSFENGGKKLIKVINQ